MVKHICQKRINIVSLDWLVGSLLGLAAKEAFKVLFELSDLSSKLVIRMLLFGMIESLFNDQMSVVGIQALVSPSLRVGINLILHLLLQLIVVKCDVTVSLLG